MIRLTKPSGNILHSEGKFTHKHIVIHYFKRVNLNLIPHMLSDFSSQEAPQRQTVQSISLLHQGRLVRIDVKRTVVWKQCV